MRKIVRSMCAATLVTGPRQVGKTTLLKHAAAADRRYVTLDDALLRELAVRDPALFLERFPPPLLIDEIQYAPQLMPQIKMRVDNQGIQGAYWLTGSQMFHLMKDVSESLAGRVGIVNLLGLSQAEIAGRPSSPFLPSSELLARHREAASPEDLASVFTMIHRGSMPALYSGAVLPDTE
ncbi:MAG: AAA family ATPase, partial [Spirochaetota bacterium]